MGHWITFDDATRAALACAPEKAEIEAKQGELLTELLAAAPATALLRADEGQIAVLQVRRNAVAQPQARAARRSEATGFLGLSDEAIYEEEPVKKSWWKRALD